MWDGLHTGLNLGKDDFIFIYTLSFWRSGSGKITHIIYHNDFRIGLIGLVEKEWLDTLPTIDPNEVTYIDFVKAVS